MCVWVYVYIFMDRSNSLKKSFFSWCRRFGRSDIFISLGSISLYVVRARIRNVRCGISENAVCACCGNSCVLLCVLLCVLCYESSGMRSCMAFIPFLYRPEINSKWLSKFDIFVIFSLVQKSHVVWLLQRPRRVRHQIWFTCLFLVLIKLQF